jgi:hypothetical protein
MTNGDTMRLVHPDAGIMAERIARVETVAHIGNALQIVACLTDGRTMGITLAPGQPLEVGEVIA